MLRMYTGSRAEHDGVTYINGRATVQGCLDQVAARRGRRRRRWVYGSCELAGEMRYRLKMRKEPS